MGVNLELLKLARARTKQAFVAAGDPAMGAAPSGGDPSMGGAPPGGGAPIDPAMAGGMPPPAGGMGGDPLAAIQPIIQQEIQKAMAANGGGAAGGGAAAPLKPKIDVNVELMQIKKMLAKLVDSLGVTIPAQDMVATPEDLQQMAAGSSGASQGGNNGALSPPQPMEPMKAAGEEWESGEAFQVPPYLQENAETHRKIADTASAILAIRNRK